jgi:hypothetical protein
MWVRLAAASVLLATACAAAADDLRPPAVDAFIATEKGELLGRPVTADLDGDGTPEIVFAWRQLGPAHPTQTLTVLGGAGDHAQVAAVPLTGEVMLESVKDGIITVARYPLHPPRCCPGKKFLDRYLLLEGRLVDAK